MYRENKQSYPLPPLTFVAIGLALLIGVIIFHDYINQRSVLASGDYSALSQSAPKEVLGEIVGNSKNLSGRAAEFEQAGPAVKLLYQINSDFFVGQN